MSIIVCISPLVSLMMDQKSKFVPLGINAEFVGECQTNKAAIDRVLKGEIDIVFVSPESIVTNPLFRNMLLTKPYKEHIKGLVVDEARCVKTWYVICITVCLACFTHFVC